jgi:hypothetical protein
MPERFAGIREVLALARSSAAIRLGELHQTAASAIVRG